MRIIAKTEFDNIVTASLVLTERATLLLEQSTYLEAIEVETHDATYLLARVVSLTERTYCVSEAQAQSEAPCTFYSLASAFDIDSLIMQTIEKVRAVELFEKDSLLTYNQASLASDLGAKTIANLVCANKVLSCTENDKTYIFAHSLKRYLANRKTAGRKRKPSSSEVIASLALAAE